MAQELYGDQSAKAPRDPLRLAEEFRAGLGDAALTDFLRRRIRDDAFEPGNIHFDLLDLPWADVLTTNYDTLLERAAKESRRGYDLVLSESDLAHAGGKRIIKLHGSLRDGENIVISEEDYRKYPQRRAAFVNTARQLFIENELCLLGFSGDDPNFLQWAGWVRDRLGGRARRIYLVGALDLPPVKRRLLEARGVAPIDLAPAVEGERTDRRHAAAISLFLAHLKAAGLEEPGDWKPASYRDYPSLHGEDHEAWTRDFDDPVKAVESVRAALAIWRKDRQTCPRWLVLPHDLRRSIRHGTDSVDNLSLAIDSLPENERRDSLLELAWRHDCSAQPLSPWLAERMDAIATPEALAESEPELISSLARVLLGAARAADEEGMLEARARLFEALPTPGDITALVTHERCLFARDRLDFAFVAENAGNVAGDDSAWGLRRAALLYWVGEADEALQTIGATARELQRCTLRNPDSVALRSRLAWVQLLAHALQWEDRGALLAELGGRDRLTLREYDPWEELRKLDAEVDDGLRKRLEARQIEPGFEAGTYHDNRNTVTLGNAAEVTPLGQLRHIAERAGLPIRMSHVDMLGSNLADALRLAFEPTAAWHAAFLSTKPRYPRGPIDIHFGRIPVARLDVDTVTVLRERVERAVDFWRVRVRERSDFNENDISSLRLYIETLSRLAARDDPKTAQAHARLAVELGSDDRLNHWWLDKPIGNLLKRAVSAVPPDKRRGLSSEFLRFPLAGERDANRPSMDWYDLAPDTYPFVRRCGSEGIFDARVAVFLQHLAAGGLSQPEAAVRLLHLHKEEQLTSEQVDAFADILWKGVPRQGNALPEGFNLRSHAFLVAPAPSGIDARARVYAHLFAQGARVGRPELVAAAWDRTPYLQPSEADAVRLFRDVVGWGQKKPASESIGDALTRPIQEQNERTIASVLGVVAAPALAPKDRTVERAEEALAFLDKTGLPQALAALPVFHGLDATIDERIVDAFRRSLAIGDRSATPAAVDAVDRWLHLAEAGKAPSLPDILRDRALRALERGRVGGLAHLIYLARRLIEAGRCGGPELSQITEVLEEMLAATEYGPPNGDADIESDRGISLPLVRAECVRLAHALGEKGVTRGSVRAWLKLAACDPLPEVRHAIRDATIE
ncbi:SIR2 family protein [Afifella sp. JA880]|uniref:SIR2 family NAD-dependent protein deacylase n=1 Tax=Afifella sp. JA880 TaxID=2975280 RepID=UPI0021BB53F6|nr:SIR2 family protein [Afifella sp. JA880]MCT8266856.1 SIR2 family protein [Afifella sp. JA880]